MVTHLQEGKDLLFFFSIHIPFLKELKIRDKATTWTHIPAMNQSVPKRVQVRTRSLLTATTTPQKEVRDKEGETVDREGEERKMSGGQDFML